MYFNYNQCHINVFQMSGWINRLTVYNVHVMFEISAKTIYIDNYLYSEFFLTPQNIYVICFNHLE
jgi:NADH:ubiquinone oxidoreductase subunit E